MFRVVREINRAGTTVLLVEQNARLALQHADSAFILENGRVAASGDAATFLSDQTLQALYLGRSTESHKEKAELGETKS